MIQRIQTVYLAAGVVLLAVAALAGGLTSGEVSTASWVVPVVGSGFVLALATAVAAIFLYGNRKRQRSLVVVAQILTLLIVIALFFARRSEGGLSAAGTGVSDWLLLLLPVVSYVFFLLARRGIERDIKLIKSVDRLR